MYRIICVALIGMVCSLALAEDAPKSPAALLAVAQHDIAVKKAKDAYQQALTAADAKLVVDLKAAMRQAATNGATDEVARISTTLTALATTTASATAPAPAGPTWIIGTSWLWNGDTHNIINFNVNSAVTLASGADKGFWTAVNVNAVKITTKTGEALVTFSHSRQAAVWEGSSGHAAVLKRKD